MSDAAPNRRRVVDEYTPTTEEIRDTWTVERVIYPSDIYDEQVSEARAEFDRWLAAHGAAAWDEGHEVGARAEAECCGSCPTPGPCSKQVALLTTNPYRT